ncbi:hypothetical protein CJ030_MR8G005360 [Morella rubra]|uniref:Uncharacterized protein n=1 Tax=Morella rubra TaxID=262757 RepID=A0A6A1UQ97_9ROSI|nr:hypothetical protein CJ030_MR8G005360 [Morella rubra]
MYMWDEMAEMSLEHLKSDDFVYVLSRLGSFTKLQEDGKLRAYYKIRSAFRMFNLVFRGDWCLVPVEELNYVSKCSQGPTSQGESYNSGGGTIAPFVGR